MSIRSRLGRLERLTGSTPEVTLGMLVRASYEPDYSRWLDTEIEAGRVRPGRLVELIAAVPVSDPPGITSPASGPDMDPASQCPGR